MEKNTLVNQMTENDEQNIICKKCHNAILRESLVTYLTCDKTMKKMLTLKFYMDKYSSLETHNTRNADIKQNKPLHMQDLPLTTPTKMYMCVLQADVQKDICKIYNKAHYDFRSFVVSQCLGHVSHPVNNEDQYICTSCDKRLQERSNENPGFTILWKVSTCSSRSKLPESTNKRPEYVCTCCHHMLFGKTV